MAPLEDDFEHGDAEEASDHVRARHDKIIILCVSCADNYPVCQLRRHRVL